MPFSPARLSRSTSAVLVLAAGAAACRTEQASTAPARQAGAPVRTVASAASTPLNDVRMTLRNLVTAEEAYYADHSTYTGDVAQLQGREVRWSGPDRQMHTVVFGGDSAVHVSIVGLANGGKAGWAAVATHDALPGRSCTIHVNMPDGAMPRTRLEHKSYPEGMPACDGDGQAESDVWNKWNVVAMKSTLRNLVVAQETHRHDAGRYARDATALARFRADSAMTLRFTTAADDRWAAEVTYAKMPGVVCYISINLPEAQRPVMSNGARAADGEPFCELAGGK